MEIPSKSPPKAFGSNFRASAEEKNCGNGMKIDDFSYKYKSHDYTTIQYLYEHRGGVLTVARTCLLEIPISKSDTLLVYL